MTTSFAHDTSQLAEIYDRVSDFQFEGGKRIVERLELKPGARVLDVGCGTGRLVRWMAERVGPTGHVTGMDPLFERIALARERAAGLAGVTFQLGQAEDLSAFAESSFDAVVMSAVLHWVSDKAKALAEIRRVLRAGGRLGMTTLSRELLVASTVTQVLTPVLTNPPYADRVDLSTLAIASRGHTTSELVTLVLGSGLDLAELHVVERFRRYATGEEVLEFLESSAFGNFLRIVPEEMRPQLRADLVAAFEARRSAEGIVMRDWGTLVVARRG
jgi:ubiquinone/menaquinone biosynthesis C-methylase UbiE